MSEYLNKTSILVPSQLPSFIREDPNYATFILFLQAYYEWMEQNGEVVYNSKNLLAFDDVDTTITEFIDHFMNQFMPLFPEGALSNRSLLLKTIKQMYQTKGTPASYKFLFRVLFNSDVDIETTGSMVLRASSANWTQTKYVLIDSVDSNWNQTKGYILFGQTSRGIATIENAIQRQYDTELVLTNIIRPFVSGENITVVDSMNRVVTINGSNLTSQILGFLQNVNPLSTNRGLNYNPGDPVVVYGGLNENVSTSYAANAVVGNTTTAQITSVTPTYSGHGYRPGGLTQININSLSGNGANFVVEQLDINNPFYITLLPYESIDAHANLVIGQTAYNFANLASANANTTLIDALTFPNIATYGILSTKSINPGAGYTSNTTATAIAYFQTDSSNYPSEAISNIGILNPINILDGGNGYTTNDSIIIEGGSGFGAYANITSVDLTGSITSVEYVNDPYGKYPFGGMGYQIGRLPTITVVSNTGNNAQLVVTDILGHDAQFSISSTNPGEVLTINILDSGKNYISTPNVSLRVEDLLTFNINETNLPQFGDIIYQGNIALPNYIATVNNSVLLEANTSNTLQSLYNIRVFDYSGFITGANLNIVRANTITTIAPVISNTTNGFYSQGIKTYGNGAAKAKATITSGINKGIGYYLNKDNQLSEYSVLQNQEYNDFTYKLQVQVELLKYKDSALKMLHPTGINYYPVKTNVTDKSFNFNIKTFDWLDYPLSYLLGGITSYNANVASGFSNVINFTNLNGANLANVVIASPNNFIKITTSTGNYFYSSIANVTSNTITTNDYWVSQVGNVAIGTATSNTNTISITSLTKAYQIATGKEYTSANDIISVGDFISFNGIYNQVTQISGNNITVANTFNSQQSGYISLINNVNSSNVYVTVFNPVIEIIDIETEAGDSLVDENLNSLLIG